MFLATIVKARAKLPYGILYMAKVLHAALQKKFPQVAEKELLKIVGNLIYYRYINSAIVAPDAFNIVDIKAETGGLNNDQRRNLGSVAKILQFAATKKGFADESPHLVRLNSYIIECHEKFKQFFQECCSVSIVSFPVSVSSICSKAESASSYFSASLSLVNFFCCCTTQ